MQNFIAQSMRRAGLAPANKGNVTDVSPTRNDATGTEPLAHMKIGSKWSYSTLEYPADIQQRTDLGHYMMFYINVADSPRSKYSTYNSMGDKQMEYDDDSMTETEAGDNAHNLTPGQRKMRQGQAWANDGGSDLWKGNTWTPGQSEKVVKRASYQGQMGERFGKVRTKRTTDSIVLYMPPTISTNTNAVYNSTELGGMAMETAQRVMDTVSKVDMAGGFGGTVGAIWDAIPGFIDQGIRELEKGITKAVSAVMGGDAFAGLNKMTNRAENRFLEATFNQVGFRKFSYTFKFTPKNVQETFIARDIIKTFRFHMSPELPEHGDFGRFFITPAEFDLFYMFRGDENTWLNKISTCVLTNMDVNYANGNYQTFRPVWGKGNEGAPPTEIEMKLDFQETSIITKKEILEGY